METLLNHKSVDLKSLEQTIRACLRAAAQSSRMSEEETEHLLGHPVAQSIAVAPFAAGCRDPQRTSLALLTIYIAANRTGAREAFDHHPADNEGPRRFEIAERLLADGDATVVRAAIARWELVTLYGHSRDLQKDLGLGQYNPLAQGGWDLDRKVQELWSDARFGEIALLDFILDKKIVDRILW